jgi:hypothetical protein
MARPKGFEPLTPRFVVWGRKLILLSFSANRVKNSPLRINALVAGLQTKTHIKRQHQRAQFFGQVFHRLLVSVLPMNWLSRNKNSRVSNLLGGGLPNASATGSSARA